MKKLHVLWLPSWYVQKEIPLNGCFFKEQALALKKEGVQMGIVYPEIRPLKELSLTLLCKNRFQLSHNEEEGIPVMRKHGWNLYPSLIQQQMRAWISQAERLFADYRKKYGSPDLIHAQSSIWAGIAASEIHKKTGIPYFITEHRDGFVTQNVLKTPYAQCWSTPILTKAFDQAVNVIAVSQPLQRALSAYTHHPLHVIPNSVDTDLFCPRERRESKPFCFLTVGNLELRKNIAMLLHAFKECENSELVIVGDGPEKGRLMALAKELGIASRVQFRGAMPRKQMPAIFQEADAFVLASRNESFGVVCIEALATGIPVISTRCGGPEGIINESTGVLVENNHCAELAHAMRTLKAFDSQTIRQYALREFSSRAVARKHLELYQTLIGPACVA